MNGNSVFRSTLYGGIHAAAIPALLWQHYGVLYGVLYHLFVLFWYSTAFKHRGAAVVFRTISPMFLGISHGYLIILLSHGQKILL